MIVVIKPEVDEEAILQIVQKLKRMGYGIHRSTGEKRTVLGAIGRRREDAAQTLEAIPEVEKVVYVTRPFKLVGREFQPRDTEIRIGNSSVGGKEIAVIAGPCAVESEQQLLDSARAVKSAGARFLRGGAFKPRTSPYSFQGLEQEGLGLLSRVGRETGLLVVTG